MLGDRFPAAHIRSETYTNGWCDMSSATRSTQSLLRDDERISLCETLDRVLNKGVVVAGEVVISVADIDLIYLSLRLLLTSVETMNETRATAALPKGRQMEGAA